MSSAVLRFAAACATLLLTGVAFAQDAGREAIVTETYQEVFCRPATSEELTYWSARGDWMSKASLIERQRWFIYENRSAQDEVIRNAHREVFHREPTEGEWIRWRPLVRRGLTCAALASAQRDALAGQSAAGK